MVRTALSAAQARRVALGAQGIGRAVPEGAVSSRTIRALVERLGLLQIDSVNVFERSHYLPVFARLGAYDKALLDRMTMTKGAAHLEYWAHEAAFIPRASWPLFRWAMDTRRARDHADPDGFAATHAPLLRELLAVLRAEGPLPASAVEHESNVRRGPWWGWSDVKRGFEHLFRWGDVVSAGRSGFERVYGLPDQVLPAEVLDTIPDETDAVRTLVERSIRASGVGTLADVADYHRLRSDRTRSALRDLEDAGVVVPVEVEGWGRPAWMHADATVPRRVEADAVLSPFDPVVWFRPRAERVFGFHYRIEIYTPAPKRVYGYYVLPVLQDDQVVGRVDLKSDRQHGVLRVRTAWEEPGRHLDPGRLGALLLRTADWQGLDAVAVTDRGTAAARLADALGVPLVPHEAADDAEAADSPPDGP
ncbi:winged helix-turn-helix domain-containing protein [Curtobacterium sp. MCBD17_013]|uniref:winged helix-turn-helix domain-containing protein n=1 Tax=Curtobacterium sp. MCBD17_013 TaxID=2175668 RepID=UPI000DA8D5F5|nr:crosslink repair DNA glycosylase YcaQ family protein [Curtobacterium sp. MCBD17_013]PZF58711.1 winged helix-turn-helix domain-containing protein [Curtobacterium sp. MCBD17_013]